MNIAPSTVQVWAYACDEYFGGGHGAAKRSHALRTRRRACGRACGRAAAAASPWAPSVSSQHRQRPPARALSRASAPRGPGVLRQPLPARMTYQCPTANPRGSGGAGGRAHGVPPVAAAGRPGRRRCGGGAGGRRPLRAARAGAGGGACGGRRGRAPAHEPGPGTPAAAGHCLAGGRPGAPSLPCCASRACAHGVVWSGLRERHSAHARRPKQPIYACILRACVHA